MEIYLDHNATTPLDKEVLEAMLPFFSSNFGNAASNNHYHGRQAAKAVENARAQIAQLINADSSEIIFTSGATESINIALQGLAETYSQYARHIITVSTEHKAVLDTCNHLKNKGFEVDFLSVNRQGIIDIEELKNKIRDDTFLVSIMLANNETGVVQNFLEISEIVHQKGKILMSDATTCIGKTNVDVQKLGIDIMPLSAHKFYGPKGIGALYIRRKNPRVQLSGIQFGGGHEKNIRPGTLNVPGIVGMGYAAQSCTLNSAQWISSIKKNRDYLESEILKLTPIYINGGKSNRLCNTSNITFESMKTQNFLKFAFGKIAVATGSACTSALPQPSHVLMAMGCTESQANSSLRFSLGKNTSQNDMDNTINILKEFLMLE